MIMARDERRLPTCAHIEAHQRDHHLVRALDELGVQAGAGGNGAR